MIMRKILTKPEAEEILQPYFPDIIKCIDSAFVDYQNIVDYKDNLPVYTNYNTRTKAGIIHEQIVGHISSTFAGIPIIKTGSWRRVFGMKIGNELFIRFKKLNQQKEPSNFKTLQNERYRKQLKVPGFPEEPTFLYAGYIPDASWTKLNGVYIACWVGNQIQWCIDASGVSTEQMNLFASDIQPVEISDTRRRVIVKQSNKNQSTGS